MGAPVGPCGCSGQSTHCTWAINRVQAGAVEGAWRWGALAHAAPPGRMDPFADTLQRLREVFGSGRTWPAEFRAAQLKGLSRFLQENRSFCRRRWRRTCPRWRGRGRELAASPVQSCVFCRPFPGLPCVAGALHQLSKTARQV